MDFIQHPFCKIARDGLGRDKASTMVNWLVEHAVELLALIVSGVAAMYARSSVKAAKEASAAAKDLQVKTFQRQGVIDLYGHWAEIRDINLEKGAQIDPDIVRAVHMLELTATLWNHDIVQKEILAQGFWANFKKFYEKLNQPSIQLEHRGNISAQTLLSTHVQRCYEQMKAHTLEKVQQSQL